jgi:hypothetical protein
VLVVNKNRKTPVKAVDTAMVTFLPPIANLLRFFLDQSTTRQAMIEPGIPRIEIIL